MTKNYNFFNNQLYDFEFQKKLKALKKYCPSAYKYLIFKFNKTDYFNSNDGIYVVDLPTSEEFKFVYGQIKLIYLINNKKSKFIDLEPSDFFIDGYKFDLKVYKKMYYRNSKDKFKIDLMLEMKKRRKYK